MASKLVRLGRCPAKGLTLDLVCVYLARPTNEVGSAAAAAIINQPPQRQTTQQQQPKSASITGCCCCCCYSTRSSSSNSKIRWSPFSLISSLRLSLQRSWHFSATWYHCNGAVIDTSMHFRALTLLLLRLIQMSWHMLSRIEESGRERILCFSVKIAQIGRSSSSFGVH